MRASEESLRLPQVLEGHVARPEGLLETKWGHNAQASGVQPFFASSVAYRHCRHALVSFLVRLNRIAQAC